MIGHIAKFTAHPGQRAELESFLEPMVAQAAREEGTLLYLMNRSTTEPDVIWFFELYHNQSAFEAHLGSELHHRVVSEFANYIACAPDIHHFELAQGHVHAAVAELLSAQSSR